MAHVFMFLRHIHRVVIILIAVIGIGSVTAYGQLSDAALYQPLLPTSIVMLPSDQSDPLGTQTTDTSTSRIGVEIGLNYAMQKGLYRIGCGTFDQGAELNPTTAAAYDLMLAGPLCFEALLGVQGKSVRGGYQSWETLALTFDNGASVPFDVLFENSGTASFTYLFFQPSVKAYITKAIYAGGGGNIGLLVGARAQYIRTIVTRSAVVNDLGLTEFYFDPSESSSRYTKVFPEESIFNTANIVIDGVIYIGAEFQAIGDFVFGPRLQYSLPVTAAVSMPELRLSGLQFSIGARYPLN